MAKKNLERLGITYSSGMLSATVFIGGKTVRRWENPGPVADENQLGRLLSAIPDAIQFHGSKVSLIVGGPQVEYHVVSTPPMKKKDLLQFLAWKAGAIKTGSHLWSFTKFSRSENQPVVCLHLASEMFRSVFLTFCRDNRFEPLHLLPLASAIPDVLGKRDGGDGSIELIAVTTERIAYLAGGVKNAPLFIREIPALWNSTDPNASAQFAREVKRTVLFAKKQFNKDIGAFRIIGKGASKAGEFLLGETDIPSPSIEEPVADIFETAFATTPYRTDNFLSSDMIGSARLVRRAFIAGAVMTLFSGSILSLLGIVHHNARQASRMAATIDLHGTVIAQQDSIEKLQAIRAAIEAYRGTEGFIAGSRIEPVAGYLPGYIADVLPRGLVVSRLLIDRSDPDDCWMVEIEGLGPDNPVDAAEILNQFQQRLAARPSSMSIVDSWQIQWLENLKQGARSDDPVQRKFRISGRIK
jgi:hypothetical protein